MHMSSFFGPGRSAVQLTLLTAVLLAHRADAQPVTVRPESRMILAGTSNVNRWSCSSGAFDRVTTAGRERLMKVELPLRDIAIAVPVRSLACGNDRMNADLREALRAEVHPDITFILAGYRIDALPRPGADYAAVAVGQLSVAGVVRQVEIPLRAQRTAEGLHGAGTLILRMTDFGIKPPVALFGLIRARNEITVSFDVRLDTAVLLADMP
jgi:hypothetical protein